jgi:outer membrane protein
VEEAGIVTIFMMKKRITMIRYQRLLMLGVSTMILIVETPSLAGQKSQTGENASMPKQSLRVFVDEKDGNERFLLRNQDTPLIGHKKNIKKTDKNVLLHKALVDAYSYSPKLQSKLHEYYKISENISQAMSGFRPSITGEAKTGYQVKEEQDSMGDDVIKKPDGTEVKKPWPVTHARSKNPHDVSIKVVQNLYKGGETLANIKEAQHQILSARADFVNTEQSILISAIKAYMDLWLKQEKLKIAQSNENFYEKSLEEVKGQALVGESAASMDVPLAQFKYETSVAKRMDAENDKQVARDTYLQVTGKEPVVELTLPESIRQSVEWPSSLSTLLGRVEQYHPEILKAHYAHEAEKNQVDVTSSSLLPQIDLEGSDGRSIVRSTRNETEREASVKLRMTVPIYGKGGKDWSSVRQSMQITEQKRHDIEVARDAALKTAKEIWTNLQASKTKIAHYKRAIQASKRCVKGRQQEYLVGESTLLDLMKAEQETEKLQDSLVKDLHDEVVNEYLLLSLIGDLNPQNLNLDVQSLDLNTYPEKAKNQWIGKS